VVRRIVGIAEDITERRALEQQLVGSQKLEGMGRLAGGVAHDFNNLLTAILGYSESIVRQSDPRDPLRAEALEIQRAGEKAAALTRQLLAFSKRQALKMTVVDLNVIVRDVHQMLDRLIGEHIAIEPRLATDLDAVTADSTQLEQIVVNLALNARDAMPHGGRLTITTTTADRAESDSGAFTMPAGRFTILSVADTGTGMDAQTRAQILSRSSPRRDPARGRDWDSPPSTER
jgi:signal transduction histidine kinase